LERERERERAVKGTAHAGKPHHREPRGRRGGPRCYVATTEGGGRGEGEGISL